MESGGVVVNVFAGCLLVCEVSDDAAADGFGPAGVLRRVGFEGDEVAFVDFPHVGRVAGHAGRGWSSVFCGGVAAFFGAVALPFPTAFEVPAAGGA